MTIFFLPDNRLNLPYIKLTVTDAMGNTASDSVKVTCSRFGISMAQYAYTIQQGDSAYLDKGSNIGGGIKPYKYLWTPSQGLSDSTSRYFWVKKGGAYTPVITDSMGCIGKLGTFYFVYVNPVGIAENDAVGFDVSILHNIGSQEQTLIIENKKEANCRVDLYNLMGQHIKNIYDDKILIGKNTIVNNISDLTSSIYFYKITVDGKERNRKFIKE